MDLRGLYAPRRELSFDRPKERSLLSEQVRRLALARLNYFAAIVSILAKLGDRL
jgi:hypothetical protein